MRENNDKAKEALKGKHLVSGDNISGTEAFARLFEKVAKEIDKKADDDTNKDKYKPKYRFLNTYNENESIGEASRLEKIIQDYNFIVNIYEDLDCKDVSKDNKYFIRISNINGVFIDIDLLYYEEKIRDFEFNDTDFIANNLAKIVGSVNEQVRKLAPIIADYIACVMYTRKLYKLKYNKIGWEYYIENDNSGSWIFKYDYIYTNNPLQYKYGVSNLLSLKGQLPKSLAEGLGSSDRDNKEKELEWVSHTLKIMKEHPYDGLILGAGISGLIRQLLPYTKETNININIQGDAASGKSTICHYLLSIFGDPEKIEGSFIDTSNSMEENRAKRPVLPYVLDERMLKVETETEKNKQKTLFMDVFREYEGKVKERLGKQYEESSGERIYGPIISSSVNSMMKYITRSMDLGQYRRFMEFEIGSAGDKKLFMDAAEATETEQIAYSNYGYGIGILIDYMMNQLNHIDNKGDKEDKDYTIEISSEPTIYNDRFNATKDYIEDILKAKETVKISGLTSSASRFALIVMSYQILREALLYYNYKTFKDWDLSLIQGKVKDDFENLFGTEGDRESFVNFESRCKIADHTDAIIKILVDNLVKKMQKVKGSLQGQVNKIYDYILNNREFFKEGKGGKINKTDLSEMLTFKEQCLGIYTFDADKKEIILCTPLTFYLENFLFDDKIPEPQVICDSIKTGKAKEKKKGEYYKDLHEDTVKNGKRTKIQVHEVKVDESGKLETAYYRRLVIKYIELDQEDNKEGDTE